MQKNLDSSESVLDVYERQEMGGSCDYADGQIGCILARKMHSKHQGAMAFRLDEISLSLDIFGQTASHSFCNSMVTN